jgi:hypothetical protein
MAGCHVRFTASELKPNPELKKLIERHNKQQANRKGAAGAKVGQSQKPKRQMVVDSDEDEE